MEKFTAFRDPGTGIQPFLKPLPPSGSELPLNILIPIRLTLGLIRTTLVLALALIHLVLVDGACLILSPIKPLHRLLTHAFTFLLARLALLTLGLFWIPVDTVSRKRGRTAASPEPWTPRAGDIIVSNWSSWVELLWLAARFNPIFVLPVPETDELHTEPTAPSTPISRTPGRRTGTGSAAITSASARKPAPRAPLAGFRTVSLLGMITSTGRVPTARGAHAARSLEDIRAVAGRPLVVFPECTTSNGRALLRFADVFAGVQVPVRRFRVFVMAVRVDPPTAFAPSLSHSVPSARLNPLAHVFRLASALAPLTLSVRLLPPAEAPSSGSFLLSDFLTEGSFADELSECCAALIAQIGRMKRVGMGWEDKAAFLQLYNDKK